MAVTSVKNTPVSTRSDPAGVLLVDANREHTRVIRELHRSRDELDYFVRALSHDMSANLMLLESSFGRLAESLAEVARPDLDQLATHVKACLDQSKRFVGDLVRLARTGRVDMEPEPVDLNNVVGEVLFEQRELSQSRAARVDVRRPLPTVWCNRQRVKQVLTNLVRNALKHGCNPNDARITISAPAVDPDRCGDGLVLLRIHDNGAGIAANWRQKVFLPGVRLPDAAADGSGMGLTIVKKMVEQAGGSVRIESGPSAGAAFLVGFPQVPAESTQAPLGDADPLEEGVADDRHPGGHHAAHAERQMRLDRPDRHRTHRRGRA